MQNRAVNSLLRDGYKREGIFHYIKKSAPHSFIFIQNPLCRFLLTWLLPQIGLRVLMCDPNK